MPQTPACTQRSRSEECSEATKIGRQSDAKVIGKASDEVGADIRVYRICLLDVAPGTPAQMNRNDDESQALCLEQEIEHAPCKAYENHVVGVL